MKLYEIAGVGRITKQNSTPDVGPDAIQKQAAKFGNRVDRDGKPPLINKKAYKNSTPNRVWNLGEAYTAVELAIMEGGHSLEEHNTKIDHENSLFSSLKIVGETIMRSYELDEDFTGKPKAGSRPGSLKRKAAQYLGKGAGEKLSKSDLRKLQAKANKMKNSEKKAERQRGIQLSRQISWAKNFKVTDSQ